MAERRLDPEDREDLYGNGDTFAAVMHRYSRRQVLKAGVVLSAAAVIGVGCNSTEEDKPLEDRARTEGTKGDDGRLRFAQIPPSTADSVLVPAGYASAVLIGWGDPLREADGVKDPLTLTAEDQERRFGYNNDFVAFLPVAGRHQDGSPGGHRDEPGHRECLHGDDQQLEPGGDRSRRQARDRQGRRQPEGRQQVRPHHRGPGGRR